MQVVKVKKTGEYHILNYINEIKNNTFTYFVHGIGRKKTKSFEVISDTFLLERWDENINMLYVAKVFDKYGIYVAEIYADCLVPGIVARQTAKSKGLIYQKIKDFLPENFNSDFFELLQCDYMMSCFGVFVFDIIALDKKLSKLDAEYDSENCLYKGEKISMNEYVNLKFGAEYVELINKLCTL